MKDACLTSGIGIQPVKVQLSRNSTKRRRCDTSRICPPSPNGKVKLCQRTERRRPRKAIPAITHSPPPARRRWLLRAREGRERARAPPPPPPPPPPPYSPSSVYKCRQSSSSASAFASSLRIETSERRTDGRTDGVTNSQSGGKKERKEGRKGIRVKVSESRVSSAEITAAAVATGEVFRGRATVGWLRAKS